MKFRFVSSVRFSVLNRPPGLEVPKFIDLIDMSISLVSSTLNIIPLLYLDLLEGQKRPHSVFYKFVNKKN